MNNFGEKVNFIWSVADLIRDTFKRSKYQDVILPLTVLRRIDCVLQPTKEQVLEVNARLKDRLDNLAPQLRKASGYTFYNTSLYDFERLLNDHKNLAAISATNLKELPVLMPPEGERNAILIYIKDAIAKSMPSFPEFMRLLRS
jgi:type I restriction-modification system DNA methylase subunit